MERPFLGPLLTCNTAKQVWKRLLEEHELNNTDDLYELQRQFFDAKLELGQSISQFISQLELIVGQLRDLGDLSFKNNTMISKLTLNLPKGFDHFTTVFKSTPFEHKTLSQLQLSLRKKEKIFMK
jgi:hypothetical protein